MAVNDMEALVRILALLVGQNRERAEEIVKWAYSGCKKKEKQKEETTITVSNKKKKVVKEKKELLFPFSSEAFMSAWNDLLQQPEWRKKTDNALQISLNKLSKYEEVFAIQLIEATIEKGWKGVVFDDTDERYKQWKAGKTYRPNQEPDKNDVNSLWSR